MNGKDTANAVAKKGDISSKKIAGITIPDI